MYQGHRNPQTLFHPLGEGLYLALRSFRQAYLFQLLHQQAGRGPDPAHFGEEGEVLVGAEVEIEVGSLDNGPYPPEDLPAMRPQVHTEYLDLAGRGRDQGQQHPDRRRFSGTVLTQETINIRLVHGKGEGIDGAEPFELLGKT